MGESDILRTMREVLVKMFISDYDSIALWTQSRFLNIDEPP